MTHPTTQREQPEGEEAVSLFADWFDPMEAAVRDRVRDFIETMISSELDAALARPRYARRPASKGCDDVAAEVVGHRHGRRTRTLTGTFGATEVTVPRARIASGDGRPVEWKSKAPRAYQRRTKAADALIASTYLAGTNTRRVRRALAALIDGAVGKDVVSRTWRKIKSDWDAWNGRDLAAEPILRLILDGTVVRVRLDRKATSISLLVVLGVRADGQKVLLAVKNRHGSAVLASGGSLARWAARARRPGGRRSTIWSRVGCGRPSCSSSTARPVWQRHWLPSGRTCRPSAARSTSTGTCWPMPPTGCMARSRPTIRT